MLKEKTNYPRLTKKIFPYNFYLAYWIDTNSNSSWESLDFIKNSKPSICITAGWLVSKKNNCYRFVADISFDENNEAITDCANSTTIPTYNIIKLIKIKVV